MLDSNKVYLDGLNFGYPECCIKSFILDMENFSFLTREDRKLAGTGYIPCKDCNEKCLTDELIENINNRRNKSLEIFHRHI